jgi:PAP2 superfamily protein
MDEQVGRACGGVGMTRVWALLAVLSFGDLAWCGMRGIGIADWLPFAEVSTGLFAVALAGQRWDGPGRRVAAIAEGGLSWLVFSVAGAILTYLAAARNGPLYDAQLAAADAALGFDWTAWYRFVAGHMVLKIPFAIAYHSLLAQIMFSVLWFSRPERRIRGAELLTGVIVALLLTAAVFSLFPSFGPAVGMPELRDAYVEDLVGLRNGTLPSLDIMLLKGVIAFPSFHAVLAILFTYAHRRSPMLAPVAALNAVMILSLPSEGGHYLVDVFGGIAVGLVALLATHVIPARLPMPAPATNPRAARYP